MNKKGKFIVVEGIDGSGSTTQATRMHKFLQSQKLRSHFTKEPTNYLIGGLIRSWLTGDWSSSAMCLQLLFTADRAHHLEKEIIPMLEKGVNVICDRYYYSTVAYGSLDISDTEWLREINKHFLEPDLVIYLRVSVEEAMERLKKDRNSFELFEKEKQLREVIKQYEAFTNNTDYFMPIDGSNEEKEVFEDIKSILRQKLNIEVSQ
ncbi:MAG: dTMP kinase [Candidatus Spechtbacterales bacterium]|nr:dTMP kinase [Candidatus Spechtbacterales bacterium]